MAKAYVSIVVRYDADSVQGSLGLPADCERLVDSDGYVGADDPAVVEAAILRRLEAAVARVSERFQD